MARQISISDEVYEMLKKRKGNRSFSEAIKSLAQKEPKQDISKFYGIWKKYKDLDKIEEEIMNERRRNYGRTFE